MNPILKQEKQTITALLSRTVDEASRFLASLDNRPAGINPTPVELASLPQTGLGTEQTLEHFKQRYGAELTGSAGPRYFGFVTGGATPASIVGDWLTAIFDQNTAGFDSAASYVELETISFLGELFGLPDTFSGTFVTGATISNFVSLALGRQWVARQYNINLAETGLYGLPPIKVFSSTPHASIFKALSMLGMGKNSVQTVACLPEREAVDVSALEKALQALEGQPCIVVANAGTVNTVDFDDIQAIVDLQESYNFWLHIDGAFGGFAGCSPTYQHLVAGMEHADSITIDAHKWLNVPYDAAMQFTRHQDLQLEVFQNSAAYLGEMGEQPDFLHLTPENSRRFRALPAWFSLMAYGKAGHTEIVERNCTLAQQLGANIDASSGFELLAPVRMNVVCFTLAERKEDLSMALINDCLAALRDDGRVFLTPTNYKGIPAIRAAISNWRTQPDDIDLAWEALQAYRQRI